MDPLQFVLDRGAARVTRINDTTRDAVQSIIADGVANGLTVLEVADAIEKGPVPAFSEYRSELIARTELMDVYNAAALATYGEAGIEMVEAIDGDQDEECIDRVARNPYTIDEADAEEDHPNGTLDWVPVMPTEAVAGNAMSEDVTPTEEMAASDITTNELDALSRDLVNTASRAEPDVTTDLKGIGGRADLNPNAHFTLDGKEYHTLQARLKTEDSTLRKLEGALKEDPSLTRDQLAADMKDNLRYTFTSDPATYNDATRQAVDEMVSRGYQPVRATNYWAHDSGYAGLNTNWRTADGQMFEVQFHTQEGLVIKEVESHPFYEEMRVLSADSPRYLEITQEIDNLWAPFREANPSLGEMSWLQSIFPVVR